MNPFDKRNIIERRTREKPTRQGHTYPTQLGGRRKDEGSPTSLAIVSDHRMESHPRQNEREEEVTDEISFLLAMAQRNSRKAEEFFKRKEEKSRPSERSGKKVRFKK